MVEANENGDETCKLDQQGWQAGVIERIMVGQFFSQLTNRADNRRKLMT
jgi:hypothetical protein